MVAVAGAKYSNEAEERVLAKTKHFIDTNGQQTTSEEESLDGLDISGCIKGIMINMIYKHMFNTNFIDNRLSDIRTGEPINRFETVTQTIQALKEISEYSKRTNIPIVFVNEATTTRDILSNI